MGHALLAVVQAPLASHCRLLRVLPAQVTVAGHVSGSGAFLTDTQAPAGLHAWQVPLQALLQQTPSAQKPCAHSFPLVQAAPSGFPLPQVPVFDPAAN